MGVYGAFAGSPNEGSTPHPAPAAAAAANASDSGSSCRAVNADGVGSLRQNLLRLGAKSDEESGKLVPGSIQQTVKTGQRRGNTGSGAGFGSDATEAGMFGRGARRRDNGRLATVFLVVNFMIGSGILNTPQTFRDSGLAATTVIYCVACESCSCL